MIQPLQLRAERLDPERLRSPRREDAGGLLHRRVLQPHPRDAARRRPPPAGRDAGVPAEARDARRDGRGDRDPQALLARLGRARRLRAPRRRPDRAVGDGDDDRGRLHALRPPRDRLPRRARAAHADLDEHGARAPRRRTASRSSSCRPGTTTIASRPATATPPTSRASMLGREIGVTSDAQASWWGGRGVGTVPHALIAAYGGDTVLAATKFAEWADPRPPHHRARRLRERLGRDRPRRRRRARPEALGRPARHLGPARRPLPLGRDGRLRPARRQRAARPQGARRARRRRARGRADRRLGRLLGREDRGVRASRRARRRLRRRLLADPRRERLHGATSSSPTGGRARRSAAASARTPGSSVSSSVERASVLWDVDTQVDFVLPEGKLAVPGATTAVPAMARLVDWARRTASSHVASADDHELTDPEISDDARLREHVPAALPPRHARGAEDPRDRAGRSAAALGHVAYPPGVVRALVAGRREILLLKKSFDVFTNPNAEALLDCLDPAEVIVFGVATDVCDHAAIVGPAPARPPRRVRRGRGSRPRRGAHDGVPGGVARGRCALHDERAGRQRQRT